MRAEGLTLGAPTGLTEAGGGLILFNMGVHSATGGGLGGLVGAGPGCGVAGAVVAPALKGTDGALYG